MADINGVVRLFLRLPFCLMKVLITAPSLDETRNVSGISTIVRQIIENGRSTFVHFVAGREDHERAGMAWLAKQTVLPFRFFAAIRRENIDVVHINTALTDLSIWRDAALSVAAKLAGRPLVLAIHGGKYLMNDLTSGVLKRATTGMLKRADLIVVYSEFERASIDRRWADLRIRILPNAIPFAEVPRVERHNSRPVLIFFGRMHESKGLHELVEASRELKNGSIEFEFRSYGEGPMREWFVNEMRSALDDSFTYGGVITGKEKWDKLAAADIFVLPSRYGEGLPMAMLEAMAVGCVVVTADVASVRSVIRHGENGYMVEPKNGDQLAAILKSLLADPKGWKPVQEAAIATVRDHFGIGEYIDTLESIYAEASDRNN